LSNSLWTSTSDGESSLHARRQPGLLVSARNRSEALIALDAGVDVLDLKEPEHGPLGAVDRKVLVDVIGGLEENGYLDGEGPLSVALGELLDWNEPPAQLPTQVRYAKLGLAGMTRHSDWKSRWIVAMTSLGDHVTPVAVAYADHQLANSPEPDEILAFATGYGCRAFLLDTFDKQAGALNRHLPAAELNRMIDQARNVGMTVVLAGSISRSNIQAIMECGPDLVAIRTAACSGGRTGNLCGDRIRDFKQLMSELGSTIEEQPNFPAN